MRSRVHPTACDSSQSYGLLMCQVLNLRLVCTVYMIFRRTWCVMTIASHISHVISHTVTYSQYCLYSCGIYYRYNTWHPNRPYVLSKPHFFAIFECVKPTAFECAFLSLAIYRVFRQSTLRDLIPLSTIY